MRNKTIVFWLFLGLFCVFTFNIGAGGGVAPKLVFKYWKAGRGVAGGPSDAATQPAEWYTFITDAETECQLVVKVGYARNQPSDAYRLTRVEWEVAAEVLLPGLPELERNNHTFTFAGTPTKSGAVDALGTTFTYSGDGTLSAHWRPKGTKEEKQQYCSNYDGAQNPQKGRSLKIDVTFIGYYGTDPRNEQKVEIPLSLSQDEIDQMRQEYLDQRSVQKRHKPSDPPISIPSRSDFSDANSYSNAHAHTQMIDKSLRVKHEHWRQAGDKYVGEKLKKSHRIESLTVTGGYRNVHHHLYPVVPSINR